MARILVIEDSKSLCKLYKQEFESEGYEVVIAEDAMDGLGAFESHHPDVVVLDIRMPAMDGLDVMQRILGRDRKTRVVLNSSYASYKDNYLTWVADAYLLKSSDTSELRSTIRNLIRERQDLPVPGGRDPVTSRRIRDDDVRTPASERARAIPSSGIAVAQREAPGREWPLTTRTKRKAVNR